MTNRMHTSQNNLERAFLAFNQHSLQLETAYRALQIKVSQLSGELAAARSERQREREEKERIAGRMAHLLDALPGGVLVLDADGIVAETNPAARDLLGEPLDGECWLDVLERACVAEPETNGELVLRNGRRISVSRRNLDGERGQLLLLADVTETRNLQSMLERNDRLTELGEMAASLAHQIRTPLSSAVLYASQLHRPALERAEQRQFSGRIVSRLKHLERLVNDMLVYARGGRAGQASFDAADVTAEAVRLVRAQLGDNVSMTVSVPEQALPVSGNRDALAGALANLLTNGRQAAGEDARLALTVSQAEDGGAVFEVADNGPGIAEDNAARLFEPFFTTRPDGTGLGLAVVQSVARAHGGKAWARAGAGGGAVFSLQVAAPPGVEGRNGILTSALSAPVALREDCANAEPPAGKTAVVRNVELVKASQGARV